MTHATNDLSARARELLAGQAEQAGFKTWADAIRDPTDVILESDHIALRAIEAALRSPGVGGEGPSRRVGHSQAKDGED